MNVTRGITGASSLSSSIDWGLKGCKTVGRVVFWSVPQNVHGRFLVRSVRWLTVGALLIAAVFADAMIQKRRQQQKVIGPSENRTLRDLKIFPQAYGAIMDIYRCIIDKEIGLVPKENEKALLELCKNKDMCSWADVGSAFLTQMHRCSELVYLNANSTNGSEESIGFLVFIQKLKSHFEEDEATPVMIDNGKFVCEILAISESNNRFILEIVDWTFNKKGTKRIPKNYLVSLSREGALLNSDGNGWSGGDFCVHSQWKVLFPKRRIRMILKESRPPSSGDIEAGVEQP